MKGNKDNYILGIDGATTKSGYAIIDENQNLIEYDTIRIESKDTVERIKENCLEVEKLIKKYNIKTIVLEDVTIRKQSNLKVGKDLCLLQGALLRLCFQYDIEYQMYSPTQWRSIIGTYDGTRAGTSREFQKEKAVQIINDMYNLDFKYYKSETKTKNTDDDKAEAILIALAFLKHL